MNPVKVSGKCARTDAELLENMRLAQARGLPELQLSREPRPALVVAASGPSIGNEVDRIRSLQSAGAHILAIRGAHDFLIDRGIIPNYALTIDPLPDSASCFARRHPDVEFWIAAQADPQVFNSLADCSIKLWYPWISKEAPHPKGKLLIGGGSTSGLRGLSVAYIQGYRDFHLFGFDCCLSGKSLRIDGSGTKSGEKILDIQLEEDGEVFRCTGAMAHQAQQFETYFDVMPDAAFSSYGRGLITAILAKRSQISRELSQCRETPIADDGSVSFVHFAGPEMASFRYRVQIPRDGEPGFRLNDLNASALVFAKPQAHEVMILARAMARGQWCVADFSDDHFDWPYYQEFLRLADAVTCSTPALAERIAALGHKAFVVPDPYEFPLVEPHCDGTRLLWFGHEVNRESWQRILPDLEGYDWHVVSNFEGAIPWSYETMLKEFARADIVLLPSTEPYKSANRAVEAIRQGCFVVAEPHPSLQDIPGIWIGNIKEGIEWTGRNCIEANHRLSMAQSYVTERYSPKTAVSAWKQAIQRPTTLEPVNTVGLIGSVST